VFETANFSLNAIQPFAYTPAWPDPEEEIAESTDEPDENHEVETEDERDQQQFW